MSKATVKPGILYVFVRNDLESMNPGKAMAQVCHSGTQFVREFYKNIGQMDKQMQDSIHNWLNEADGFGTTIVIECNELQHKGLESLIEMYNGYTKRLNFNGSLVYGEIIDPTYPFKMSEEMYKLCTSNNSQFPEDVMYISDTMIDEKTGNLYRNCTREETTCWYVYVPEGMKSLFIPKLKQIGLKLHR